METRWLAEKHRAALHAICDALSSIDQGDHARAREALYPALGAVLKCLGEGEANLRGDLCSRWTRPLIDLLFTTPDGAQEILAMTLDDESWAGHCDYWQRLAQEWEDAARDQPRPSWM